VKKKICVFALMNYYCLLPWSINDRVLISIFSVVILETQQRFKKKVMNLIFNVDNVVIHKTVELGSLREKQFL
jgi:hypothetical protein